MSGVNGWVQFWTVLPATLAALGALIAALHSAFKTVEVAAKVDGINTALQVKLDAARAQVVDLKTDAARSDGAT